LRKHAKKIIFSILILSVLGSFLVFKNINSAAPEDTSVHIITDDDTPTHLVVNKDSSAIAQPNILFIVVDDLRTELGCYGAEHIKSPNIDRLANEGTLFQRAYCNIPVCGASRASILSGLRPTRDRFLNYESRADKEAPEAVTLPKYLKDNGYQTISNGKVFHHIEDSQDSWSEIWRPDSNGKTYRDYVLSENIKKDKKLTGAAAYERTDVEDNVYMDGKIAEKVIEDLRKLSKSNKPFFLTAGFLKPHLPFNAPEKYWKLYDEKVRLPYNNYPPENAPKESLHNFIELRSYSDIPYLGSIEDDMALKLIHGYYACVSYTDAQVGKVLDELKKLQLEKNTIVVLLGDHGWNLDEHGLWCKTANYETSLHTPLIIRVPGKDQVGSTNEIVEFVDIYPTLCKLAGLDLPNHLQGESFKDLLFDPNAKSDGIAISQMKSGVTTIKENFFYTEWIDDEDKSYARMLYDHNVDKDENYNISEQPKSASVVQELSNDMRNKRGENYFKNN
tara:strand:- start:6322 stop:7833 length:1512 start_codon:yes stop_codon:yes gene_type:complete